METTKRYYAYDKKTQLALKAVANVWFARGAEAKQRGCYYEDGPSVSTMQSCLRLAETQTPYGCPTFRDMHPGKGPLRIMTSVKELNGLGLTPTTKELMNYNYLKTGHTARNVEQLAVLVEAKLLKNEGRKGYEVTDFGRELMAEYGL